MSKCLDKTKFEIYIDIPEHTTPSGGTIPPSLCVTPLKPDLVIIDKKKKTIHIFELTCSFETNIEDANRRKSNKYQHFETDLADTGLKPFIVPFEVGSRGLVTEDNRARLKKIHSFCKPEIVFKKFVKNLSALAVNSSYFVFLMRNEPLWTDTASLLPPFKD